MAVCNYTDTVTSKGWNATELKKRLCIFCRSLAIVLIQCITDARDIQSDSCRVVSVCLPK
jgi:hypothetical protein